MLVSQVHMDFRIIMTIRRTSEEGYVFMASFSEQYNVGGVLLSLVHLEDGSNTANYSEGSFLVVMDRSVPHTLSLNLLSGLYQVSAYDIEENGLLFTGINYPAVTSPLIKDGTEYTFLTGLVLNHAGHNPSL